MRPAVAPISQTIVAERPGVAEEPQPDPDTASDLYDSQQLRTREETNRFYGYVYDKGTAARIELARVEPKRVEAGAPFSLVMTYVIFTHSDEPVLLEETRELWFGQHLRATWKNQTEKKGGTFRSTLMVRLPEDAPSGKHKIVYRVRTRHSRDLREAAFSVVDSNDDEAKRP